MARKDVTDGYISQDMEDANDNFIELYLTKTEVENARGTESTLSDRLDAIRTEAAASTYYGNWSALTGALSKPASVSHDDLLWQLNTDLADVTVKEPGVDTEWDEITSDRWANEIFKGDWSSLTGSLTYPAFVSHDRKLWALNADLADVTAKEPGVATEWEEMQPNLTEDVQALGSITANTAIDLDDGTVVTATIGADLTLSVTNWPASGVLGEMLLVLTNGGAHTITWPTINWIISDGSTTTTFADNETTLQTSGVDFVFIWTMDGGTTLYGKIVR